MEAGDWSRVAKRGSCSLKSALKKIKRTIDKQIAPSQGIQSRLIRVYEALQEERPTPMEFNVKKQGSNVEMKKEEVDLKSNGRIDASHWKTFLDSLTDEPVLAQPMLGKDSLDTPQSKRVKRTRVSGNQKTRKKQKKQQTNDMSIQTEVN
eukprot:g2297.t1